MKLEDYLKTRNITDDSTDEEIRRAVDIKMFGVTFSRYLSNSSTTPEDFRSALEFIELIGYTDKLILPGQTYKVFITSKALARRINLDPIPVLNVESPTTPSQAKFKARQEEKDRTPRASMLSFHDSPSPRMMFGEPDSPPLGEISPPLPPHPATPPRGRRSLQEPAEIKRLSVVTDDSQHPGSTSSYDTASEHFTPRSPLEEWLQENQTHHWYKYFVREFPYTFSRAEYTKDPPSIQSHTEADAAANDFQAYINVQVTLLPDDYLQLSPLRVRQMTSEELAKEYLFNVRVIRTAIDIPTGYVGDIIWKSPRRFPATVQKLRNLQVEIIRRAELHHLNVNQHHRYLEGTPNLRTPSASPRPQAGPSRSSPNRSRSSKERSS